VSGAALNGLAAAGWAAAGALFLALLTVRSAESRRRRALNRALHELRRPLQAMLLGPAAASCGAGDLVSAALGRLEAEVNGGPSPAELSTVAPRSVLEQAVARWQPRARASGGALELSWRARVDAVLADAADLAQAIDNLLVNALDHGGPPVRIEATSRPGRLRIAVVDGGRDGRPPTVGAPKDERHGHGLAVVQRFAFRHRGRFFVHGLERGTVAVLELPAGGGGGAA
jgi:two-component system sensor histidine kinase MtrB